MTKIANNESRRDFLYYATAGAGTVAIGAAVWPLIDQMNPTADVQALLSIRVDISSLEPGTQLAVKWRGKPVFIRYRTEEEIAAAQADEVSDLPDIEARNPNLAGETFATDENRADTDEWTHHTVLPRGRSDPIAALDR